MVHHLVEVKELKVEDQFLLVEVALVELMVGMALCLPMDTVEESLEFMSKLCVHDLGFEAGILFQGAWKFIPIFAACLESAQDLVKLCRLP